MSVVRTSVKKVCTLFKYHILLSINTFDNLDSSILNATDDLWIF